MSAPSAHSARPGEPIGTFRRGTGLAEWNRYAAVNEEFVPIHMDDEAGRSAGYPGAIGMGNLQVTYLHNLLRGFAGPGSRLTYFSCQFRRPNLKGQVLTAQGHVTSVAETSGQRIVNVDVWIEDETGTVLCPGSATVVVSRLASESGGNPK